MKLKFEGLKSGFVYIIENGKGRVKIGKSITPTIRTRCVETQGGFSSTKIFISKEILCHNIAERLMHKLLSKHRCIGEWFNIDFEYAKELFESERWKTNEYEIAVNKQLRKKLNLETKEVNFMFDTIVAPTYESKTPIVEIIYHCDLCRCPIYEYKELKTYPGNYCEMYYDYMDFRGKTFDKYKEIDKDVYMQKCFFELKEYHANVPDFMVVIEELINIDIDLGIINYSNNNLICA